MRNKGQLDNINSAVPKRYKLFNHIIKHEPLINQKSALKFK